MTHQNPRTLSALVTAADDDTLTLRAPHIGRFTVALQDGQLVEPGVLLGTLEVLRARHPVVAPAGAVGRLARMTSRRRARPVAYGEELLRLRAASVTAGGALEDAADEGVPDLPANAVVFRAPMDGQFYRRPSPDAVVAPGDTIGLIEVMKFFYPIELEGDASMRVERIFVEDSTPIESEQILVVFVPLA